MVSAEMFVVGFFGFILVLGIAMSLHARSIDPPLENEEYLAKNPELRELKRKQEQENNESNE